MVVPFADDIYYRSRPKLGIQADKVLKLDTYAGLNGKLTGLQALFDEGHLAVVQGVGYPNPNRSHFRSTEIWQTASDADRNESHGWLGKYFDSCCSGADPTVGVAIGEQTPQAFVGNTPTGVTFARPEQFRWQHSEKGKGATNVEESFFRQLNGMDEDAAAGSNEGGSITTIAGGTKPDQGALDFLERTALDAQLSSDKILAIARKYKSTIPYPPGPLAASLSMIARMIAGGLPTRVYYASQGGFDTHAGQFRPGRADDVQRIRAASSGECQRRDRSRSRCADVCSGREGQGRVVWETSEPVGAGSRRPEVQHRLSQRLWNNPREMAESAERSGARTEILDAGGSEKLKAEESREREVGDRKSEVGGLKSSCPRRKNS